MINKHVMLYRERSTKWRQISPASLGLAYLDLRDRLLEDIRCRRVNGEEDYD